MFPTCQPCERPASTCTRYRGLSQAVACGARVAEDIRREPRAGSALAARRRSARARAFVRVERRLRAFARLFAPLRAKVTSSAQPTGPPSSGEQDRASILADPQDERAALHSITSSARA